MLRSHLSDRDRNELKMTSSSGFNDVRNYYPSHVAVRFVLQSEITEVSAREIVVVLAFGSGLETPK